MGCCNEPSVALTQAAQNPALHVNFTKGMVLGVDDFTQEFTYLANRDQWAIRELLGYGTSSGLAISVDNDGANGPRVKVAEGTAIVPSGKLICVPNDQCALLNSWLAKADNAKINELLTVSSPPLSPPATSGTISLYLTLCYKDCTTLPVPIPGDPCRSDDQLMADSRIADSYFLELRPKPPSQKEEDAVRDFVAWLKQITIIDVTSPPSSTNEQGWLDALKAAAKPWFDLETASPPASPPLSPPALDDFMSGSPPSTFVVAKTDLSAFLKVAFRFWVTDLRPMWMSRMCGAIANADDDCVLLARLELPIILAGSPIGTWQIAGDANVVAIDESTRPFLVHLRLLQEWLFYNTVTDTPTVPITPIVLPQNLAPSDSPRFAGLTTTGAMHIAISTIDADQELNEAHHCVVCNGGLSLTLPRCAAGNLGRVYIVKSPTADSKITCDAADSIDVAGTTTVAIPTGKAITLVSDGNNGWHIISALA